MFITCSVNSAHYSPNKFWKHYKQFLAQNPYIKFMPCREYCVKEGHVAVSWSTQIFDHYKYAAVSLEYFRVATEQGKTRNFDVHFFRQGKHKEHRDNFEVLKIKQCTKIWWDISMILTIVVNFELMNLEMEWGCYACGRVDSGNVSLCRDRGISFILKPKKQGKSWEDRENVGKLILIGVWATLDESLFSWTQIPFRWLMSEHCNFLLQSGADWRTALHPRELSCNQYFSKTPPNNNSAYPWKISKYSFCGDILNNFPIMVDPETLTIVWSNQVKQNLKPTSKGASWHWHQISLKSSTWIKSKVPEAVEKKYVQILTSKGFENCICHLSFIKCARK